MATEVRLRRGTAAENDAFTGAAGEVTVDLTNKTLRVHDALDAGGRRMLHEAQVTATSTDTTAGRLLKVGDFGLGGVVIEKTSADDYNTNFTTGFYHYPVNSPNAPTGAGYRLIVVSRGSSSSGTQLAIENLSGGGHIYMREHSQAAWTAWRKVLDAADVTTSPTDTTAGRLLKVGDFGVGDTLENITDWDAILPTGFYRDIGLSTPGQPANRRFNVINIDRGAGRVAQFAAAVDSSFSEPRVYTRVYEGEWRPWRELYHQGSILGTVSQASGVPTGAVIERDSNGNGEYVKFADGTMVCTHVANIDVESTAAQQFTFPAVFEGYRAAAVTWGLRSGGANAALNNTNVSRFAHGDGVWAFQLATAGVSGAPETELESVVLGAFGRWF